MDDGGEGTAWEAEVADRAVEVRCLRTACHDPCGPSCHDRVHVVVTDFSKLDAFSAISPMSFLFKPPQRCLRINSDNPQTLGFQACHKRHLHILWRRRIGRSDDLFKVRAPVTA